MVPSWKSTAGSRANPSTRRARASRAGRPCGRMSTASSVTFRATRPVVSVNGNVCAGARRLRGGEAGQTPPGRPRRRRCRQCDAHAGTLPRPRARPAAQSDGRRWGTDERRPAVIDAASPATDPGRAAPAAGRDSGGRGGPRCGLSGRRVVAVGVLPQLVDHVDVDDRRAMDADEAARIERRVEDRRAGRDAGAPRRRACAA